MVMARPRFPHPVILGFAALAMLCVVGYSLVLLYQYHLTGSTGIATRNPLIVVNAVLIAGNLIAGSVAVIGLLVASARARRWGWFTFGAVGLLVMLFSIGIFSIIALVPACYYALYVYPRTAGR
jgi:ATP/ADP translocase